jgi:hypothetical protein
VKKLFLLFQTIVLDAIVTFLLVPIHFIYLVIRYNAEFAGAGKGFIIILFISLPLLFAINTVYSICKLAVDDLNAFDKIRCYSGWFMLHTLILMYFELTSGGLSVMFFVECVASALVYTTFVIYTYHSIYTRLAIAQH